MLLKLRKIFTIISLLISIFFFTSCTQDSTTRILPDLTGLTREEIKAVLEEEQIKYVFKFDYTSVPESKLNQFIKYEKNYKAGDTIDAKYQIYVYTTLLPLNFDYTSQVTLDKEYENKSFVEDGIGQVILAKTVDGDTAHFYDKNGDYIKVRFLGVDTPESTYEVDPWGKAASSFTSNILRNATTIVLESEGARTDSYGRYLAYVWVDGVLLNLKIVQEAYSNSLLSSQNKYFKIFQEAGNKAMQTGRRFYGEIDPDYDY